MPNIYFPSQILTYRSSSLCLFGICHTSPTSFKLLAKYSTWCFFGYSLLKDRFWHFFFSAALSTKWKKQILFVETKMCTFSISDSSVSYISATVMWCLAAIVKRPCFGREPQKLWKNTEKRSYHIFIPFKYVTCQMLLVIMLLYLM